MRTHVTTVSTAVVVMAAHLAAAQAPERGGSPGVERGDRAQGRATAVERTTTSPNEPVGAIEGVSRSQPFTLAEPAMFGDVKVVSPGRSWDGLGSTLPPGGSTRRRLSAMFEFDPAPPFRFSPLAAADLPEAVWMVDVYRPRGFASWLRLQIEPRYALVYVDGFYAGLVENFDGPSRRLRLPLGHHFVEILAPGYEPLVLDVWQQHDVHGTYRGKLTPK